jgi:hypothetical protein
MNTVMPHGLLILCLWIFCFSSCTSHRPDPKLVPLKIREFESLLLPGIPIWANGSSQFRCFREPSLQFLHSERLISYQGLSLIQALHVQSRLNQKILAKKKSLLTTLETTKKEAPLKDIQFFRLTELELDFLLNESIQEIKSGALMFEVSPQEALSVFVFEEVKKEKAVFQALLNQLRGGERIVVVSFCETSQEVELRLQDFPLLKGNSFLVVGIDWLTAAQKSDEYTPLQIPLATLFLTQKIELFFKLKHYPELALPEKEQVKWVDFD